MNDASDEDTLLQAADRGDLEAVRRFVEVEGAAASSCSDSCGTTALINATCALARGIRESNQVMRYLISKNVDVDASYPYDGKTALMVASEHGNLEAVQILLEEGRANVNRALPTTKCTALSFAIRNISSHGVVPILLQHGANVNPPIRVPPLFEACRCHGSSEVVQQLLTHGANVHEEDRYGREILHVAVEESDEATVRLLIACGGNVNAILRRVHEIQSETPLSIAAQHGKATMVQVLLDHHAEVDVGRIVLKCKTHNAAESLAIILDHCRQTMSEAEFSRCLLSQDNELCSAALHYAQTAEIAKLLVEQPHSQYNQLPSVCRAQLVHADSWWSDRTPRRMAEDHSCTEVSAYLMSFESLVLSIPCGWTVDTASSAVKRRKVSIAVKLNPALNDFQRSVAQEAWGLIVNTTDLPDSIAHAIIGHLSPLDVMKRTDKMP